MQDINLIKIYEKIAVKLKEHFNLKCHINSIAKLENQGEFLIKNISFLNTSYDDGRRNIIFKTDILYFERDVKSEKLLEIQEKLSIILGNGIQVDKRFLHFIDGLEFQIIDNILHCMFSIDFNVVKEEYNVLDDNLDDNFIDKKYEFMRNLIIRKE